MSIFRYIVRDVEQAAEFYRRFFGFEIVEKYGPAMAIVARGEEKLWLAGPISSAGLPLADGRVPEPGGWSRIVIQVMEIENIVRMMKSKGVTFRSDVIEGPGGKQALCEDPSGNAIELFEAKQAVAPGGGS